MYYDYMIQNLGSIWECYVRNANWHIGNFNNCFILFGCAMWSICSDSVRMAYYAGLEERQPRQEYYFRRPHQPYRFEPVKLTQCAIHTRDVRLRAMLQRPGDSSDGLDDVLGATRETNAA
ncbi:hypothetical protein PsYK624_167880 [Phanerochaete sordida]|uniref:Uncharacterized protein n=1 Tax=Phanerochaete sordida TaxID=48140 RepID=A0A9P3LM67_9APHY|nr:hypothetical protein PsYK624_167880 [Phanerochaete sordida]